MTKSKKFTPFQKGFIIFFVALSIFTFLLPGITHNSTWETVFGVVSIIGLISAVSGVFNSIYIARADIYCYVFWIINTLTYAFVAYENKLYGQVIQNIIFIFPLEVIGFIAWTKNLKKKKAENTGDQGIDVKKFGKKEWTFTIIGLIVFWIVYAIFLKYLPEILHGLFGIHVAPDSDLFFDSLTAILTIYAVWLTGARYIEQWTFWILSNGIGIVLFLIPLVGDIMNHTLNSSTLSGAVGWIQYGTSAVYGFVCWRALYKKETAKNVALN
ncbi:nicotinamide riboside transporter PnuC [Clostridium thermobutyricum]|uniref:nicotinamide riboside transporter PnuC n=1 Tax=Clostridium thermobutyricum TaxID=29372 RepID=UPI0018A94C61|nr:nicotinamide riboside transporter PnuC [Clostridium thermobutyricum]